MSRTDAVKVSPELASANVAIDSPGIDGAKQVVAYNSTNEIEHTYMIAPVRVLLAVARAWGPGVKLDDGVPRTTWFNAETGDRATLEDTRLIFDRAQHWKKWLGSGPSIATLGDDCIGHTIEELEATRGNSLHADSERKNAAPLLHLEIPASQWAPDSHEDVSIHVAGGRVTKIGVALPYDTRDTRDQMLQSFDAKWGHRMKTPAGFEYRVGARTVDVNELGAAFLIDISQAK